VFHPAKTRGIWKYQANEFTVKLTVSSSRRRRTHRQPASFLSWMRVASAVWIGRCGHSRWLPRCLFRVPSERVARSIAVFTLAMGTSDRPLSISSPVPRSLAFL